MDPRERAKLRSEISTAFETGSIFQADNEKLLQYLQSLCSEDVPNEAVRHRELLRGFTINYIQMARLIGLLETRNKRTQLWFMVLAVGSILLGLIELLF
jgi:hypothetical protein